jgi:hypothetical protein
MKIKTIALLGALMLSNAFAVTTLTYNIDTVLVGTVQPYQATPWGLITINELDDDSVLLSIDSHLYHGAYYSSIGLNLVDSFAFAPVTFTAYPVTGGFTLPTISVGNDVKSGGAGVGYDIWFDFATSNANGGIQRFNMDDFYTYRVDGVGINDFNTTNNPVIFHAQNLNGGASSWVGTSQVPEPSAMILGAVGMFFLLTKRRRA